MSPVSGENPLRGSRAKEWQSGRNPTGHTGV